MPDTSGSTATFHSSNPTLDAVWRLVQHSALDSAQEQFLDTPTREKGQFLADANNESLATMAGFGEQNLTRQALLDFAHSQARYWPDGRLNAVYPNGDGKRDIPDFTERYPGLAVAVLRADGRPRDRRRSCCRSSRTSPTTSGARSTRPPGS